MSDVGKKAADFIVEIDPYGDRFSAREMNELRGIDTAKKQMAEAVPECKCANQGECDGSCTHPAPKSEQGKNGEFYTKGNVVWKSPIVRRNEADNGDTITVGFPVCTASEFIYAETLAGAFTEHAAMQSKTWRCFHCDDVFTTEHSARLHFGSTETSEPACKIKAGAEGSMLEALRRAEDEAESILADLHNENTEAAKAFFSMRGRHSKQLVAAEELGYERGLRDAREEMRAAEQESEESNG